jgi:hypothetical protein
MLWRREKSCPYRDWNSNLSVVQQVASLYIDCLIHQNKIEIKMKLDLFVIKKHMRALTRRDEIVINEQIIGHIINLNCLVYRILVAMGKVKLVVHETESLPKYKWTNMNMAWEYSDGNQAYILHNRENNCFIYR